MRKALLLLILVAPLGFCFTNLGDFPFPARSIYSDLAISHYPNAVYLLHSISTWRQIPLWSDSILSGYPFAADPLSGLWYLPGWLAYLFPLPLGFNLNVLLHLVWGGLGVFIFLRKENKSDFAALAGAILFELFSKNFAHYAAGHLTLMYAIAWTPWVFLSERFFRTGRLSLLAGVFLGLTALADVRWFAFVFTAWLMFALYQRWIERIETRSWTFLLRVAACSGTALLIAAPLLLPLLEFTGLTTRAGMSAGDRLMSSLPPAYLAGLAIPDLQGFAEWMVYPGGAALVLALFSLSVPELRRRNAFWIGMIIISLVVASGSFTPLGDLLFRLPGFSLLRVPARAIFFLGWSFAVIAADCIHFLAFPGERMQDPDRKAPGNGLAIAALAGFLALVCAGLLVYTHSLPVNYAWGTIAIGLATAIVLARRSGHLQAGVFVSLVIALICLDLGGVDFVGLRFVPPKNALAIGQAEAEWIKAQDDGVFRIYSPSYSLPQQTAAANQIDLADGVNPLQIQGYTAYMEKATGIPFTGYSVTLPPFATASPETDNQGKNPDASLLGRLNVKYIVSAFDLHSPGLLLRNQVGDSKIYENVTFRPRAWVQADFDLNGAAIAPASSLTWTPNEIRLTAKGGGWLILSEIYYQGWTATVDEKLVPITPYDSLLRAIELPPGDHQVTFSYAPTSLTIGLILAGIGWLVAVGSFLIRGRRW
ncbi:MAG TPA: YfhO family protein [Anaerolineaceae bacterium]|nr:YfhO family protein [Anaerolineaceae bacterium]